jgi:hypothetical protein
MGSAFIALTVQSVPLLCWLPGPFFPLVLLVFLV